MMGTDVCKGKVRWFDRNRGYGFIIDKDGDDVMVHYSAIPGEVGRRFLEQGDDVEYIAGKGDDGRKRVIQVMQFTRSL